MPFPETLDANPKIIFFTDFDGTVTLKDTNDYMTDNHGSGHEQRGKINHDILDGRDTLRNGFQKMLDSWTTSFPETIEILKKNIKLDPQFASFMRWATANAVPVIVLSSGMVPVIRALLEQLLEDKGLASSIEIVANDVMTRSPTNILDEKNGWTIKYHDGSGFGHDKSLTIRPYAEAIARMPEGKPRPTLLYAGDGASDISAARETEVLFAKDALLTYCKREKIPCTTFKDWTDILEKTKEILEEKRTSKQ